MNGLTNLCFTCSHCGGTLEFPSVCENGTVNCYHCGMTTWLQKGKQPARAAGPVVPAIAAKETPLIKTSIQASVGKDFGPPGAARRSTLMALVWIGVVCFLVGFGVALILKQDRPPFRFHSAAPDSNPTVQSSVHRSQAFETRTIQRVGERE